MIDLLYSLPLLAHGEAHSLLNGSGGNQLAFAGDVIAWHGHLHLIAIGAGHAINLAGHVAGSEIEHWHVAGHHRVGAATLILLCEVDVGLELGVSLGGTRCADHLTTEHGVLLDTTAQHAHSVACRALGEVSVEHANTSDHGLLRLLTTAQDLHLVALLHNALLDSASAHGTSTGDREHVLNSQEEGLVRLTLGCGDVVIHGVHELQNLVDPLVIACAQRCLQPACATFRPFLVPGLLFMASKAWRADPGASH